jgi:major capsid protein Gp23
MGQPGKWEKFLAELDEGAQGTAKSILKSQQDYLQAITAAMMSPVKATQVAPFTKFAFPIIRKAAPQLVASNLVSVQPMTGPLGGIQFYQPRYGSPSNPVKVGDSVQTTRKINKKIISGVVQEVVTGSRRGLQKQLAVVENAQTGKKHRIDPDDLKKVTALDVIATVA